MKNFEFQPDAVSLMKEKSQLQAFLKQCIPIQKRGPTWTHVSSCHNKIAKRQKSSGTNNFKVKRHARSFTGLFHNTFNTLFYIPFWVVLSGNIITTGIYHVASQFALKHSMSYEAEPFIFNGTMMLLMMYYDHVLSFDWSYYKTSKLF